MNIKRENMFVLFIVLLFVLSMLLINSCAKTASASYPEAACTKQDIRQSAGYLYTCKAEDGTICYLYANGHNHEGSISCVK